MSSSSLRRLMGVWLRERNKCGCIAAPLLQVGFEGFEFIGLQGMQPGKGVLEALNPKAVLLQVEVGGAQHPHLRRTQAVAVSEEEHGIIAF
jgi:hypothetical protein